MPELYINDAEAIEKNSRDYLSRSHLLNSDALALVQQLDSSARDPASVVHRAFYPWMNESGQNYYQRFMRPATSDLRPRYGCLFTIEFDDSAATIAFYDHLEAHNGPHLGAPVTLAFAYTMCSYKNKLDWAMQYGLKPTQIRISAGLEDAKQFIDTFSVAVEAANEVKKGSREDT